MNNLIDRADYGNLGRLVRLASGTRGFDVQVNGEERIEPINAALGRLATIEKTPITQTIRKRAIDTLISRLNNIAHLRTEAQNGDFIASVLVEVLGTNKAVIDDEVLAVAICLANNKRGAFSNTIFDVLYTVATTQTEYVYRRTKAMSALGHLGDERAVLALLNAAGMDAYGEELLLDSNTSSPSSYDIQRLQNAAADGLGGMIFAQECEGFTIVE